MTIDIFEHNELNEGKLYQKIFTYTSIVVLIIILNIIILFGIRKKIYYQNNLYIVNKKIVTNISVNDLETITSNKIIYLNKKPYNYKVSEIELVNDVMPFYKVYLSIDGDYEKNNIMNYKIFLRDDNLFNYLIYLIGGKNGENK